METFLLYQHFRPTPEPIRGPPRRAHFWLHFLLQSCQLLRTAGPQGDQCLVRPSSWGTWEKGRPLPTYAHTPPCHLQVLVLEMNQVLQPARLEVQGTNPVSAVTLSLLEPETQVKSPLSPPTHG